MLYSKFISRLQTHMTNELERITVTGYKSIRELDLELRSLNVLIGANGSGKSNFISLFRLLNEILEKRLQRYSGSIGADNLLYYGRKVTSHINIELSFKTDRPNMVSEYEISLIPSSNKLIFGDEFVGFHDRNSDDVAPALIGIGSGNGETNLFDVSGPYEATAEHVRSALQSWKIYHFHDTSSSSKMKQGQSINDNQQLQGDASNIAAFLYLLQEKYPHNYKQIVRTIKRVTPFFDNFVLRPDPLNEKNILLQWKDVNSDNLFDASTLSDGTLRFVCLATLLLQPELPSVILIDEPELGLHPYAINILAGLLRSAATKTQVIVSTQSVPLVNQFEATDILVVDREEGQSTFKHVDEAELQEWMTEYSSYGLGDLWEKNILGGRPQPEAQ
jgi:predicted ATPase